MVRVIRSTHEVFAVVVVGVEKEVERKGERKRERWKTFHVDPKRKITNFLLVKDHRPSEKVRD
jgi:hypothetical protein